eukprot:437051-Prorocentrum_minimum.AAC.1
MLTVHCLGAAAVCRLAATLHDYEVAFEQLRRGRSTLAILPGGVAPGGADSGVGGSVSGGRTEGAWGNYDADVLA